MRFNDPPIFRISPLPEDEAPRRHFNESRRPHAPARIERVGVLVRTTGYTYKEIARRTGTSPASVCRYARAHGWRRPADACHPTQKACEPRRVAVQRRRTLADQLLAQARRLADEQSGRARVNPRHLATALRLLETARALAYRERVRRRPGSPKTRPEDDQPILPPRKQKRRTARNGFGMSARQIAQERRHAWMMERV